MQGTHVVSNLQTNAIVNLSLFSNFRISTEDPDSFDALEVWSDRKKLTRWCRAALKLKKTSDLI